MKKLLGIYMSLEGTTVPIVSVRGRPTLVRLDDEYMDAYMASLCQVANVDGFYQPNRGFWRGSDLNKIIKMLGGELKVLTPDTCYSLKDLKRDSFGGIHIPRKERKIR